MSNHKDYQVAVIGSGPGGYVAAIRCAQLGMKTAIIEKYDTLGGTCLNVGCIPSKALLDSTEHYHNSVTHFKEHGINISEPKIDFTQMINRKGKVVGQNVEGIDYLMKKNKIDVFCGVASFIDPHTLKIVGKKENKITAEKMIIATGSKPANIPFIKIDKKHIITSTEALSLKEIPKHLIIIGGGVIGVELGSVYARLGAKVSVVEFMDHLIPTMDNTLGKELQKSLKNLGIDFYLGHKVSAVHKKGKNISVSAENKQGKTIKIVGDYCLVSIGRKPYTASLNLDNAGVKVNEQGQIITDKQLRTHSHHIYAIGDVIEGPMLAHKASEEGTMVAEIMAGQKPHINYLLIPSVVYTWPEVASVGFTEEQLKKQGIAYKTGKFPYKALGRARASMDVDGLVKILADKQTDEILGVHIIGARAADMIASGVMAMEMRMSAEDIARISHAHPTYMEAFKEAALAATENRPIHQ